MRVALALLLALSLLGRHAILRWSGHGREYVGWRNRTAVAMIVHEWDGWWVCEPKATGAPGRIIGGPFRTAERARERAEVDVK